MRVLALAIGGFILFAAQFAQADERFERSLKLLDPGERLAQLCDYTAMVAIRNDARHFRPDRALAAARAEPLMKQDSIVAKGGAFRSRRKWYELSYSCTATPDHMKVISFKYTIGKEIPETQWAGFGLWD
ncbi:MAG TPA: DUF930 domain-containing protein [Pseudolabrys sp.]|nr:DUF930 domain-containing protein [Pseudolabrys sp.]